MYKVSDLSTEYKKKLITADQAAAMVKNGDRLHFGLGCGSIIDIDKAIAKRADELRDITVISTVSIREKPVFRRSTRKLPTFTFFSSADVAYYMPCYP